MLQKELLCKEMLTVTKKLLTLLLSATTLVAGCHSGQKSSTATFTELPTSSLRAQWSRDLQLSGDSAARMYVRGDSLFVYSKQNMVYHMNRKSGDVVFISDAAKPGDIIKPPVVVKDYVVIPTDTGLVYLSQRGFVEKTLNLRQPLLSGVAAEGNAFYLGVNSTDGSGRLLSVDPSRPYSPARWELKTAGSVVSMPAVYAGTIYAASTDGSVYAMNQDRTSVWGINHGSFHTGGQIVADLVAEKSGVYVASEDSKLYCLDQRNGKIHWQYYAGAPLYDAPAVTSTAVYVNVRGRGVAAIAKGEGEFNRKAKWVFPDATAFLAEGDKYVFLRGADDKILAVDKNTGKFKFASVRKDLRVFAVNSTDGVVYAATRDGKVLAAVAVTDPGTVGQLVWVEPSQVGTFLASR